MIDSTRALLDQLMGKDRNEEPEKRRKRRWDDKDVCEYFNCGFCCYDLFTNTKSDLGFCDKDHDELCQAEFRKQPLSTQCRYERKFLRFLHEQVRAVDTRIKRGKERQEPKLEKDKDNETVSVSGPYAAEITSKNEALRTLQSEAEKLGEEGKMNLLTEKMLKIEAVKKEKEALEAKNKVSTVTYGVDQIPMTICEICGVWKSDNPEDARAKNHFQGKQHLGFEKIRQKIEELEQKEGVGKGDVPRERSRSRSRGRRDRSRTRESRDRRKSGSRDRKKSSSRSRDRRSRRRRRRESSSSESD